MGFARLSIHMKLKQKAAGYFGEASDHSPRVNVESVTTISPANTTVREGSPGLSNSNSKNSLRILIPNEMIGAILGKDGATIRMITQLTKARVDVHHRESLGTTEKAVTIIGPPGVLQYEASHHMMKIMQHELLVTSGIFDTGRITIHSLHACHAPQGIYWFITS